MKNRILPALTIAALLSANAHAQKNRTFAITGETKGSYTWNTLREIDLSTGDVLKTHFDKATNNIEIVSTDNSKISVTADARFSNRMAPMADGVAAAAYDAKHDRLYYTCMRGTQLRYFDLSGAAAKVVYKQDKNLFEGNRFDEANVITRMAFASDGAGYAITNDGNHLIRFTSDQKAAISDLGPLTDGKKNGTVSIHAQCSSWGGDMVGDAYGNLYLVTYRNYIFRVNPKTRVADLVGQVKGLPAQFTSNGMVVDDNGEVILSSAVVADAYYKVNISTLEATQLRKGNDQVYNASDLANSNLLFQNNSVSTPAVSAEVIGNNLLSVYPNPVTAKVFTVQFDKLPAGKYDLVLADAAGRNVVSRALTVNALGQVERVSLPKAAAGGMYLLKLTGQNRSVVYSNKLLVQ